VSVISSIKHFLSYFIPVRIRDYPSDLSGCLEVNLVEGRKLLDTDVSNYSYGSLQRILLQGLKQVDFKRVSSVLLLGLGGGSVIETIRRDLKSDASITAVDIDPAVIRIARDEFSIERYGVTLVQADAAEYVLGKPGYFDLIIVDVFIRNSVPERFTCSQFLQALQGTLSERGTLMFNTMRETMPAEVLHRIIQAFRENGLAVRVEERVEGTNDVIIASTSPGGVLR
jgi:spermidine synthase